MAGKLITIAEFDDSTKAFMALQRLEDSKIQGFLLNQNASNIYAGVPAIGRIQLQVLQCDEQKAKKALEFKADEEIEVDEQEEQ